MVSGVVFTISRCLLSCSVFEIIECIVCYTKWRLQRAYRKTYEKRIIANIPRGLSACVFTQLSDVEGEINGLITYDRRVDKMDRNFVKSVNDRVKY